MSANNKLLFLPGDGIGPEIMTEVRRVVDWLDRNKSVTFDITEGLIGGAAIDETGIPLPNETLEAAHSVDAVLLGAVGGPKWEGLPFEVQPERGLLGIRKELGLFANLRPAIVFDALANSSTLKLEVVKGLDIMIIRELTGGIYFGEPRGIEILDEQTRKGFNTLTYTTPEIHRIARVAMELAGKRSNRVCSIDKANVLEATVMWREEIIKVADSYPEIELTHMYVDNAAMQLVRNPKQFDVIVTTNMFGDILSDCAAMLTGSLGMLPSASLGEPNESGRQAALYEPVHGSAPDISGKGVANPLAQILSFSMLLRYSFDMFDCADLIDQAVQNVLNQGLRTADIMENGKKIVSTSQMGNAIVSELDKITI
ncbi:MAG: 3-isopropylmalate dehydrogenase [Pseudomonadota bacterium]|nr:3-isopropylmalate dehydrogenase [Pseudomonadota bacterium]